ncbi:hypothetical protein RJ639_008087 [Escallonia herrerae]|uniref:RNase H type-1 domain-containing protein n=1 Tax=Escallonia herrerae TaxID=1293975 RepID=A0AA88VTU0_9ASTE|nr:hypothetical protein RJ639_008087 [Escallonia herrerae]
MYFDGEAHHEGAGTAVVFITLEGDVLPYSFTLSQRCSNNVVEYQALIHGLKMAAERKQFQLHIYGDYKLVINQLLNEYEVKKPKLVAYYEYARKIIERLGEVTLEHVPRKDNKQVDPLAKLASTLSLLDEKSEVIICHSWVVSPLFNSENGHIDEVNVISVLETDKEDWRQPFIDYLKHGKLPSDPRRRTDIRRRSPRFIYYIDVLYRRSFDGCRIEFKIFSVPEGFVEAPFDVLDFGTFDATFLLVLMMILVGIEASSSRFDNHAASTGTTKENLPPQAIMLSTLKTLRRM